MIDLHCHILPGLDDGALDLADSLAMAAVAEHDGVEVICATPHVRHDHDVRVGELAGRVEGLNDELAQAGVGLRVATGGEVAERMVAQATGEELRLASLGGGGRWILLEPAPGPLGEALLETIDGLRERGFGSVVAHPERHAGERFRERLAAAVERGALVQVTAALIAAGPAAPLMLELAGHGLVHLLGSDAHSSHGGRTTRLSAGLARLAEVERLRPHLDWIAREGPAAILRGEPIAAPFGPA